MLQLNIGSQLPLDPMVTNMAMNMGADIMKQKQKEVEGMVEKYISVGQLKVSLFASRQANSRIFQTSSLFSIILLSTIRTLPRN